MMFRIQQSLPMERARDYIRTTKPRVTLLFLLTGFTGLVLGAESRLSFGLVAGTLGGLGMTVGGAAALNCYLERDRDRLMERTRGRPLPAARISAAGVLWTAAFLLMAGEAVLFFVAGLPAAAVAGAGAAYYVFVYTLLLKPRSAYSPVPGGLAGVAPALVGYVAARATVTADGAGGASGIEYLDIAYLAVLIFLWSPPHFWSLALARRTEYENAGIPSLPVVRGVRETRRQIAAHSLALVAISLLPAASGRMGALYLVGVCLAGCLLVYRLAWLYVRPSIGTAGAFFRFSGIYLAVLMAAMTFDRMFMAAPAWAGAPSMLRPESAQAEDIVSLAVILLVICVGILVVVEGLLLTSIIRFRKRPESEAAQVHGNQTLEVVWTAIPAVLVAVILAVTITTMNSMELPGGALPLRVNGHQWWWEIGYPQAGVYTANEIHVPEGRAVDISLTSADVIHSFWVPQLGGKTDMIPGHVNRTGFMAASAGRYLGECAEFCGLEHARMRFWMVVETPEEFSAWIEHQAEPAAEPSAPEAQTGRDVYASLPCQGCHAIRTTPADPNAPAPAVIAPDLTHFGSRLSLAAGTLDNTPENLREWLRDPQEVKPGNLMPTLDLTEEQIDQVVAYLEGLE